MNWIFSTAQRDAAVEFHRTNGFVGFDDLLSLDEMASVRRAVEECERSGTLKVGGDEFVPNQDIIFAHPGLEKLCRHPSIVGVVRDLVGGPIELQHAKFNAKPLKDGGSGEVAWHQDFPFYPHTNFDMVSCIVHLDEETIESGPVRMVNGSHRLGPLSHVRDGKFAYECTDMARVADLPSTLLTVPAGMVTFHHVLTVHRSDAKTADGNRRIIVFQYRACDSAQIAGVIWKCTGHPVDPSAPEERHARFPDGSRVELRGCGGRLYDVTGALQPNK